MLGPVPYPGTIGGALAPAIEYGFASDVCYGTMHGTEAQNDGENRPESIPTNHGIDLMLKVASLLHG